MWRYGTTYTSLLYPVNFTSSCKLGLGIISAGIKTVVHTSSLTTESAVGLSVLSASIRDAVRHSTSTVTEASVTASIVSAQITKDNKPPTYHQYDYKPQAKLGVTIQSAQITRQLGRISQDYKSSATLQLAIASVTITKGG